MVCDRTQSHLFLLFLSKPFPLSHRGFPVIKVLSEFLQKLDSNKIIIVHIVSSFEKQNALLTKVLTASLNQCVNDIIPERNSVDVLQLVNVERHSS